MGCAAGIGFGIQHVKPNRTVVVLDGDGSVLMKLGTLATIGSNKPVRFIHIILDNETYESTGGQQTVSPTVDFCGVAGACGYIRCYRVDTRHGLIQAIHSIKKNQGPSLLHIKVLSSSETSLGRPNLKPFQVKKRFMKFLAEADNNV